MDWSERIGRRIRLRDLHILLAVVQCKSMAKAAEHLAVSKPVVSKVIADLEHTLGVRLLERDRHGAEATIYGAALLKRGLIVFDELHQGVKDIALNLGGLSYMDSAGLGELISVHSTVTRAGGRIKLFNLTKRVSELLVITKVLTVFDVYDSEREALKSFPAAAS